MNIKLTNLIEKFFGEKFSALFSVNRIRTIVESIVSAIYNIRVKILVRVFHYLIFFIGISDEEIV